MKKILFFTFVSFFLLKMPAALSQRVNPDLLALTNMDKLMSNTKSIQEGYELQRNYWTLIGILSSLDTYRQHFLEKENLIDLFPLAYYHTTLLEMRKIANGDFVYPIEKMKQMIAFYDAYRYNRFYWDSKQIAKVEPHWKRHFEYSSGILVSANPVCSEMGEVLALGIIAHVGYDFPRTIKYAYDTRFDRTLKADDEVLRTEFDSTKALFAESVELTLTDASKVSCWKWWLEATSTPWLVNFFKMGEPYIQITNTLLPKDIIEMRNYAYKQAFSNKPFLGLNNEKLIIHPHLEGNLEVIERGRKICEVQSAGSIKPNAIIINADSLLNFSKGFAVVKRGRLDGIINRLGEIVVPIGKFQIADPDNDYFFQFGLCKVWKKDINNYKIHGYINLQGELIIPYQFNYTGFYTADLGFGREPLPANDKPLHLINGKGKKLGIDLMYTNVSLDNGKLTWSVNETGKGENRRYFFTDFTGKQKLNGIYLKAHDFHDGLAAVKKGPDYYHGKWGFINNKGMVVVPFIYDNEPGDFNSGRAAVNLGTIKNSKGKLVTNYGYIDRSGHLINSLSQKSLYATNDKNQLEEWTTFNEGYVIQGDPNGSYIANFVDTSGVKSNLVNLKCSFYYKGTLVQSLASAEVGSKGYVYMLNFSRLFPDPVKNGMLYISYYSSDTSNQDQKIGSISPKGEVLIPPVFNQLSEFDQVSKLAYASFTQADGKIVKGYVDINGIFVMILN